MDNFTFIRVRDNEEDNYRLLVFISKFNFNIKTYRLCIVLLLLIRKSNYSKLNIRNPSAINSSKANLSIESDKIFEDALTVLEVVISTSRKAKGRDSKGNQSLPQRLRVVIFVSPRTNPPARFLARRTVTYLQRSATCRAKVTLLVVC